MKSSIIIFTLVTFVIMISSCTKRDDMETLPKNSINGDYLYESNSKYYKSDGQFDTEITSNGSIFMKLNSSVLYIEVRPSIGYIYQVHCNNIQHHGDTTTFRINRQEISIGDQLFSLQGSNELSVGSFGYHDGYYTGKKVYFKYRSLNTSSLDIAKTYIVATKRN